MYSKLNNGGGFNVYGLSCAERESTDDMDPNSKIGLGCKDNMINND